MHQIDKIYTDYPFYGIRKITRQLKNEGYPVNHKRVQRLMRVMGIQAIFPGKNSSQPDNSHPVFPYLLEDFKVKYPNQVWGTDITYIKLNKNWLYLVAIIDWFSRYVIAWNLSDSLTMDFCIQTLEEALSQNIPKIHNSDQGSQFTSLEYTNILQAKNIKISMDGKGRCFDNIFTERLWRTVKYEEVYLKDYQSPLEARRSLTEYFKFYNQKRFHQSLNYQTPEKVYFNSQI